MFLDGCIKLEGKEMRFSIARVGEATQKGELLPVVISLHGGGGAPAPVNDQQWANQQQLYLNGIFILKVDFEVTPLFVSVVPNPCLYVCPRAPTNTWNLWHEAHVDLMLIRLVDNLVSMFGADSDRVYLIGYSAGGDGVFKLAPRLASLVN
jgi:poly(3-hydroxybutyrate) depolymerase